MGGVSVFILGALLAMVVAGHPTIDPLWQNDTIPPYPSLTDPSTQNTLGTRLFGWKGCTVRESQDIAEAYNDFYTLAQQDGVAKNIDWASPAALEFWGSSKGKYAIQDSRRAEIQQIFEAAQQVYSSWWGLRPSLWIRVSCSGNDGTGDPDNVCADRPTNPPPPNNCPSGQVPAGSDPADAGRARLQAYSNPNEEDDLLYSEIVFCTGFFNLNNLATAVRLGLAKNTGAERDNLESYDNRARCFFHEVTHLDFFMNTGEKGSATGPPIDDVSIRVREVGKPITERSAYGPYYSKVLQRYKAIGKGGYYTQRNADSYAFFALAKYVTGKLGHYPYNPKVTQRPEDAPRNSHHESFNLAQNEIEDLVETEEEAAAEGTVDELEPPYSTGLDEYGDPLNNGTFNQVLGPFINGFVPRCGDRAGPLPAALFNNATPDPVSRMRGRMYS